MDESEWPPIKAFPERQQQKLKWLVRHADENHIVEEGCALRYGREWRINRAKLPEFLAALTLRTLERERHKSKGPAADERRSAASTARKRRA